MKKKKKEIILPDFSGDYGPLNPDAFVSLRHVSKIYDKKVLAVYDFNLDIQKNEFIVFVGPSGCGKSTTLRMIAGLEEITDGELYIDGVLSNELTPKERDISMVFQSYALYPHMSVFDNMAFGLKIRHFPKEEIEERVKQAAEILQLTDYLDRKPKALSGGQRQRVALGRAIVRKAKVFLMDEPLSNLDAKLRVQMRSEIIKIHEAMKSTTIYVTHDQTEAMTMADRVVVMKDGYIQQIGTPSVIYNSPSNLFVAGFIGSPSMNFLDATYEDGKVVLCNNVKLSLTKDLKKEHDAFYEKKVQDYEKEIASLNDKKPQAVNEDTIKAFDEEIRKLEEYKAKAEQYLKGKSHPVKFGVRPEDIDVIEKGGMELEVGICELLGDEYYLHSKLGEDNLIIKTSSRKEIKSHTKINVEFEEERCHIFDIDSTERIY